MKFSTARRLPLPMMSSRFTRRVILAALVTVFATDALQDATADGETRTLKMHHTHSKEDITVVYKRNGRYDEQGLAKLNYFLRDWRNHDQIKMDPRLFDVVWEAYQDAGGTQPIHIISSYRSPATNSMLRRRSRGVAKNSQHMLGKAMDFNIPGVSLDRLRAAGLRQQRGGVGFYPGSNFVHLDVGSIRHWPRMSPDALARVFPNGRTVHVPSDGRPLPGYALALADVARRGSSPSATSVFAARDAGIDTRAASGKRSFIARVFSGGGADDEDDDQRNSARRDLKPVEEAPKVATRLAPTQVATVMPMPRARPNRALETALIASASQRPSPAQVVASRGFWTGADVAAASAPEKPEKPQTGERLAWQVGAQPVALQSSQNASAVTKKSPAPRARPEAVLASAGDLTASVPWPASLPRPEKPSAVVMAYAPPTADEPARKSPARAASPMGIVKPPKATAPVVAAKRGNQPTSFSRLGDNPWLRGVMLAPSLYAAMDVTVYGELNTREIANLMRKPKAIVFNDFADEPDFGLSAGAFSGDAVRFVPTLVLGTATASLN